MASITNIARVAFGAVASTVTDTVERLGLRGARSAARDRQTRSIRDPNPVMTQDTLLGVDGQPGKIEFSAKLWPRMATNMATQRNAIHSADWVLRMPYDDPTPDERLFFDVATRLVRTLQTDTANNRGSLAESLATAADGYWYGSTYYAASIDATHGNRLEVFHVDSSSILREEWGDDGTPDQGRLLGLWQYTEQGDAFIPVDYSPDHGRGQLVVVCWGEPWPTGYAAGRPILAFVDAAVEALQAYKNRSRLESGTIIVKLGQGIGSAAAKKIRDYVNSVVIKGGARLVTLGGDTNVESYAIEYPKGAATDPTVYWRYVDATVDHMFQTTMGSLVGAEGGSRALGEALGESDRAATAAFISVLGQKWSEAVFGWLWRRLREVGVLTTDGRLPVLVVASADIEMNATERASLVTPLIPSMPADMAQRTVAWLLEQAGAPESVVYGDEDEQTQATPPLAMSACGHDGCACGNGHDHDGVDFAAADTLKTDAFGGHFFGSKTLEQMTDVERSVAWGALQDATDAAEARLARELERATADHRAKLVQAFAELPRNASVSQISSVRNAAAAEALEAYARIIGEEADRAAQLGREHGAREQRQQVRGGASTAPAGSASPEISDAARLTYEQMRAQTAASAMAISDRIANEVQTAWASGADLSQWESRITTQGIVRQAAQVLATGENAGRLEVAGEIAETSGLVVVEVQRTSVRDRNRCRVCAERDGGANPDVGVWDLRTPEGVARFSTDPIAMTPDPMCLGAPNCRCGLLPVWARAEDV